MVSACRLVAPVKVTSPVNPGRSLEGILLFAILAIAIWRFGALKRPGLVSGVFLIGYGAARSFVENFREPDSFVAGLPPPLTMGMLLSAPILILGLWLLARARRSASAG